MSIKKITITGTIELTPETETLIPLSQGRGPWVVEHVRVISVLRVYRDKIGMTRSDLLVEKI